MHRRAARGLVAAFTLLIGIVALGTVRAALAPLSEPLAHIAGAAAFGIGMMLLVAAPAELFTANFLAPTAAALTWPRPGMPRRLLRLWGTTLLANLAGGVLLALLFAAPGVLSAPAAATLRRLAEEILGRGAGTAFLGAIGGGALLAMLSVLLQVAPRRASRLAMAYLVGFLLALGAFEHVVVSALHVLLGLFLGAAIPLDALLGWVALVGAGNVLGGLGLVTAAYGFQAKATHEQG